MLEDWPSLFRLEVSYRLLMPKVRQFPVGAVAQVVSVPGRGNFGKKKTRAGREYGRGKQTSGGVVSAVGSKDRMEGGGVSGCRKERNSASENDLRGIFEE